jgi:hypothetical protein
VHFIGSCEDVPMPCMRDTDPIVLHFQVASCLNNSMTRVATYYFLLVLHLSCRTTVRRLVIVAGYHGPPVRAINVYYVNTLPLTVMPTTTSAKQESDSEDLDYVPEDHGMTCCRTLSYSPLSHAFSL